MILLPQFAYSIDPNCEKGDAVFTPLDVKSFEDIGHAAIYYRYVYDSTTPFHWVIQASGLGETVVLKKFEEIIGKGYYGACTAPISLTAENRRDIVRIALSQAGCGYALRDWPAIKQPASSPCDGDGTFRCDGLVEYCYEQTGLDFGKGAGEGFFTIDEEKENCLFDQFIFFPQALRARMTPTSKTLPTITIIKPDNNKIISGTVCIQANANDISGIYCVEFYWDVISKDNHYIGQDSTEPYEYNWNTTNVPDGQHKLYVTAYDNAGNKSTANPITITVDNTPATLPTVKTEKATSVTDTASTINGIITNNGGANIDEKRFSWGLTSSCSDGWTNNVTVSGNNFSYRLTGLNPGTTYYFQSWAHNSAGWGKGSYSSFTTTSPNNPPNTPTGANQYRSDGITVISEGATTPENTVIFKGTVSDPDSDQVQLEIELRRIDELPFTGVPIWSSSLVSSGSQVIYTRGGLINASYHWQYRAKDSKGATSSWKEFGTVGNTDFTVSVVSTYYIKGYVKDSSNNGITGVTVTLSGASNQNKTTGVDGYYEFSNLSSGNYTVTPSKTSYTFTPASRGYNPLNSNQDNQNFTGTYNSPTVIGSITVYNASGGFLGTYTTIQTGINACPVGGTVSVAAGNYTEAVHINKRIALIGAGSNSTTITAQGLSATNTVTFDGDSTNNALISGFRITGAIGDWPNGSGIYCGTSSPTITNNIISENGYGIYCFSSFPTIISNTISRNSSNGIYCYFSSPTITNNTISGNSGVGIFCSFSSFPTITNNTISENGFGIDCYFSSPFITNNTISGNSRQGIYCSSSSSFITNNTISGNSKHGIYCISSSPFITNNIITENGTTNASYYGISNYSGTPTISYNCVWGNGLPITNNYYNCSGGLGSITANPQFIGAGDFHLQSTSSCINAGLNAAPSIPTTDKDSNPRIVNGTVDIGAYEYQDTPLPSQYGSLTITSTPSSAKIYLDNTDTGSVTTYTFTNVSVGTHTIKLTLSGYYDWYGTTTVSAGSTTCVYATLTETPCVVGSVTVHNASGEFVETYTTIQAGVNACPTGGTVSVADGTYTEVVSINKGIVLVGAGSNSTTITAAGLSTNTVTFSGTATNNASISGFRITGASNGIYCHNGSPTITNCHLSGNSGYGIYCNSSSPSITNNTISGNGFAGIYCESSSPSITNNIITENSTTNTYYYGIYVYSGTSIINYNCVWGNGSPTTNNYYKCSAGANNISANPKFIGTGDFHLGTTSPCIDKGSNTAPAISSTDKDGKPRIANGIVDMGAYEHQGTPILPTTGSLTITSTPPGSSIFLDGTSTGTITPATLTNIIPGTHTIKLTKAGYYDWSGSVTVTAGTATPVIATMTLTVSISSPINGAILVGATQTLLSGTVIGTDSITGTLTYNGIASTLNIAGGSFTTTITLHKGKNIIIVSVRKQAGNTGFATVIIEVADKKEIIPPGQKPTIALDDSTKIEILDNPFTNATATITINDNPDEANFALADQNLPKGVDISGLAEAVREFKLFERENANAGTTTGRFKITIPYPATIPDDKARDLKIYWLNTDANRWELAGGKSDMANHTVTVEVTHLSIFMAAFLSSPLPPKVIVYPNPYNARRDDRIYFKGTIELSLIRIFTLSGELVKEIKASNNTQDWDVKNAAGCTLASGMYFYLITDTQGNKATGKIAVIR